MEAAWDTLGKAANLAQLSGVDATMLVVAILTWLQFPQNHKQCVKLQRRVKMLRQLLQCPTGCRTVIIHHPEIGGLVSKALQDADALIETYSKSSLWCRLRNGRSMAIQLRDMRNAVDCYCGIVVVANASLLMKQPNPHCPIDVRIQVNDDVPVSVLPATASSVGPDSDVHSLD